MHVFCDESGGTDPANDIFLVAAVTISGVAATRLLKSFRKAVRWAEVEIKGHALRPEQRRIFFDLIDREADFGSVVVTCQRSAALGGWAMGALPEIALYRCLLCEACKAAAGAGIEPLTITADGGRYKRSNLKRIEGDLVRAAKDWTTDRRRTSMRFENSISIPGLQVADVIANTAFQSLATTPAAAQAETLLHPLRSSGRLTLRSATLPGSRPTWLTVG